MKRSQHRHRAARHLEQVCEPRAPGGQRGSQRGCPQGRPHRLVAERAQRDDHTNPVEQLELAAQERRALVALGRSRLVRRRRAPNRCSDVRVAQHQPVVDADRRRLVREAAPEHRREQEVARTVAREHAPGAIAAVRRGREADDQHAGARIAETRHRPGPVGLVAKRRPLLARDRFAPFDEARARATARDLACERVEIAGTRLDHESDPTATGRYPPRPMRVLLLVNSTASSVTPEKARRHSQDPRVAPRRGGRGDVAPRTRDAARARRSRRRLRRGRGARRRRHAQRGRGRPVAHAHRTRSAPGRIHQRVLADARLSAHGRRRGPRARRRARQRVATPGGRRHGRRSTVPVLCGHRLRRRGDPPGRAPLAVGQADGVASAPHRRRGAHVLQRRRSPHARAHRRGRRPRLSDVRFAIVSKATPVHATSDASRSTSRETPDRHAPLAHRVHPAASTHARRWRGVVDPHRQVPREPQRRGRARRSRRRCTSTPTRRSRIRSTATTRATRTSWSSACSPTRSRSLFRQRGDHDVGNVRDDESTPAAASARASSGSSTVHTLTRRPAVCAAAIPSAPAASADPTSGFSHA